MSMATMKARPWRRDDETGFGPLPGLTDDDARPPAQPNFAACPKGGQCVMAQRPGSGAPKCIKCGRTL